MGALPSFFFGTRDTNKSDAPPPPGSANSCSDDVQSWCKNTADYSLQKNGVKWDTCMCEEAMQKDVESVVSMKSQYIQDLGPVSDAALERKEEAEERGDEIEREQALVLDSFDNSSKVPKQGSPGSYEDDPRWTMELTKRVSSRVFVDADRKGAIYRRSKLSSRIFYDPLGKQLNPNFGEIDSVFGFSGRA
mgnify:CR=1 FL=1|tara:strand:+ start:403 stop:975 length:573 start_codon:yes stop_codon:yes gene_type:complete